MTVEMEPEAAERQRDHFFYVTKAFDGKNIVPLPYSTDILSDVETPSKRVIHLVKSIGTPK